MFAPFKLRSTLGRTYNVDLDDILRTKKALKNIGLFETPAHGLTKFPDEPLFHGIERFQRSHGLTPDGVMKPDGETAMALGKVMAVRDQRSHVRPNPRKERATFGLFGELGQHRTNQPRDIVSTRRALAMTGHLPRSLLRSDNNRASGELFEALKGFQRTTGVKVDGWLRPFGETERELDRRITPVIRNLKSTDDNITERKSGDDQEQATAAVIPPIVYKVAEFFGMAIMAAWVWWQSMSAAQQAKVRRQMEGDGDGGNSEADCDHLHFNVDVPVCNGISRKRGKQAVAKCFASATERYAACRRGVPIDQLPPLDIWNN